MWDSFKEGITFEKSGLFLKWYTPIKKLKFIGNPKLESGGGHASIIWENEALLNGITGNWSVHYWAWENEAFPIRIINRIFGYFSRYKDILIRNKFKSIDLEYSGDKKSFEAYEYLKTHLLGIFGDPQIQKEEHEKTSEWIFEDFHIHLYLFEIHEYHCSLSIGKN